MKFVIRVYNLDSYMERMLFWKSGDRNNLLPFCIQTDKLQGDCYICIKVMLHSESAIFVNCVYAHVKKCLG